MMRSGRIRMVAGLLAGVVLGAAGPMLSAVAWHSGNGSGNSVVTASAGVLLEQRASAVWLGSYAIEVVQRTRAAGLVAEQRQEAAAAGVLEVVARGAVCDGDGCDPGHEWRGSFVLPADPQQALFVMDPLASTALLEATLIDEQTGEQCHFSVDWRSEATPDLVDADAGTTVEGRERITARAGSVASRDEADTRVVASCWRTDSRIEFGFGGGLLDASLVLEADIERAHLCVFVPSRVLVCPLDD